MNVLVIGGAGRLADGLINKLKKEGHKVYLLTGDPYKKAKYEKVFERYDFVYDSDNIQEVFESINPDVTIYLGAFDSNFRWKEEQREGIKYTSGLMNVLLAFAALKKGRFIYLSSEEVYRGHYDMDIDETEPTNAGGLKGMTLAQAERICENYQKNWELDLVVLRMDHLYGTPKNASQIDNICARMCIEAMEKGHIAVDSNEIISLLHEKDAVEFIYHFVWEDYHRYGLYNISSGHEITTLELAKLIESELGMTENIVESISGNGRRILSVKAFDKEFDCDAIRKPEEHVKQLVAYMQKHKNVFLYAEEEQLSWRERILEKGGWFIKACIPFIENMIVFIPFFMLNNRAVGMEYFSNIDLYLIYVLIFAIIYGQQQATFSAFLAVLGYLFRQTYERTGFEVMLDYNTYIWIAQLFVVGLIVGYMRDEIRMIRKESKELEDHMNVQLRDIKDINDSNVRVKDVLEQQVIDQKDSIGKIYDITSQLDQYMPVEVLFYAVEMLTDILDSKDIAIYNVYDSVYARLFSASSEKARSLGNSIRYKDLEPVYEAIKNQTVYINKSLDEAYPLMANGIYEKDKLQLIIMVWGIPWEKMTLAQSNLLVVVSYLIQNAVLRANRYMAALEDERYHEGTQILEPDAFESLMDAYLKAREKGLVECTLLKLDSEVKEYDHLDAIMRDTDYIGTRQDGLVYALLTNTNKTDAAKAIQRFDVAGLKGEIVEKY